ncbi:hypothetical protein ACHAWF_016822 [Thalassiosira exigua]
MRCGVIIIVLHDDDTTNAMTVRHRLAVAARPLPSSPLSARGPYSPDPLELPLHPLHPLPLFSPRVVGVLLAAEAMAPTASLASFPPPGKRDPPVRRKTTPRASPSRARALLTNRRIYEDDRSRDDEDDRDETRVPLVR